MKALKLSPSWYDRLSPVISLPKTEALFDFLTHERVGGKTIYPDFDDIFNAFNVTPFNQVKVVILGQDPYHGFNQANGLSFSVNSNE